MSDDFEVERVRNETADRIPLLLSMAECERGSKKYGGNSRNGRLP